MKSTRQPGDHKQAVKAPKKNKALTNPGKPDNDPDQTPEREVKNLPKASPSKGIDYGKNDIGLKK